MTSEDLKNLVKSHFSLVEAEETVTTETVEETFGELKDENGAFTIKFPGDSLQIGDKVTVETAEGQEMDCSRRRTQTLKMVQRLKTKRFSSN